MSELPNRQNKKPYYGICDVCNDWHKGEPLCDFPVSQEIEKIQTQLQAYKEMCEVYERANEFYADKATWMYSSGSPRNNNSDICKDMDCSTFKHEGRGGKAARAARAKVAEIKKKIEGEG